MKLLAKDGIYIKDFPRRIGNTDIPSGGRADVMIRCSKEGTYDISDDGYKIGSVTVINTLETPAKNLAKWSPTYPNYLHDLRNTTATPIAKNCNCRLQMMNEDIINGKKFNPSHIEHTIELGSVVERHIMGLNLHIFHQHVNAF